MKVTTDILVLGAGALGASVAAELSARGREVCLVDRGGVSASSLAAGMLAPAFETVLDEATRAHGPLLRAGRDLWADFASAHGVRLHREGAEWRGADAEAMAERLREAGFEARHEAGRAFTPEDWRLEPRQALSALATSVGRHGEVAEGEEAIRAVREPRGWRIGMASGAEIRARILVAAGGWNGRIPGLEALPVLTPIRGQAVRAWGRSPPHVIRGAGVYVAPAPDGAVIGATMEPGEGEARFDAAVCDALVKRGLMLAPELGRPERLEPYAGIRGAGVDGLPYAGRIADALFVALAPRRNGWLLAPLVARVVADAVADRAPAPWAMVLAPERDPAVNRPG